MISQSGGHLPALDGWRAVAIGMVLFCHVRLPGAALAGLAQYGALGVHLFFAISGFLITTRLLEECRSTGRISLPRFYVRRAFRILPPALVYLFAVAVLGLALRAIPMDAAQLSAAALFYRNYYVAQSAAAGWYTGHYWSLSVEEHFYLLWPALLVALGTARSRWAAPSLALTFALWRTLDTRQAWVAAWNPGLRDLVGRTDYRMDGLLWGCALAFLWNSPGSRRWMQAHLRSGYAAAAIAGMAACLLWEPPGYVAMLALLMPLPLICTVAAPRGWLGRALEHRFPCWFGRISYSVYLWQMLFLPAYGIPVSLGYLQTFPLNLVLIVLCASASYYGIERPMRRWGRLLAERIGAGERIAHPIAIARGA